MMEEKEKNKKIIAGFELTLMFLSIFAFTYIISQTNEYSKDNQQNNNNLSLFSGIKIIWKILLEKIESPIVPLVSASGDLGCCQKTNSGAVCATSKESDCAETFVPGSACKDVPSCTTGCCYEPSTGHYTQNTINSLCTSNDGEWTSGSCQDIPGARTGCCVIGDSTMTSLTEKECQVQSEALGFSETDWRIDLSDAKCIFLSEAKSMGACVNSEKGCTFVSGSQCPSPSVFHKGYLCTAPELNTTCERQTLGEYKTTCVDGKDEVYFMDSCGNPANVYDANKRDDDSYWTTIQEPICGTSSTNGNADSKTCGNCDRYTGGICASADKDGFKPDYGNHYCKDMGCKFDFGNGQEVSVKNGESWCMYDGKVGNGDDIVGSSHWKYQCSQGEITSTRCGDEYRNSICINVSEGLRQSGLDTNIRTAACVQNNYRECISVNEDAAGDEDLLTSKCSEIPGCAIENVDIGNYFKFKVCRPKYPAGFDFDSQTSSQMASDLCKSITVECDIPRKPEGALFGDGGCSYAKDEDGNKVNTKCTSQEFTQKMNELCRSMGDCGATVNINGKYTENFDISYNLTDMGHSDDMPDESTLRSNTQHLNKTNKDLLLATHGDFIQSIYEDYSKIAFGDGMISGLGTDEYGKPLDATQIWGYSLAGLGALIYAGFGISTGGFSIASVTAAVQGASVGMYLGPLMGAALGVAAGLLIADALGYSSEAASLLAAGLGIAGLSLGLALAGVSLGPLAPLWWALLAAAAVVSTVLGFISGLSQDKCDPISITYTCEPYQQPLGKVDCSSCNDDPLRPCNDYRCESIGAACKMINKGTPYEECASIPDDGLPPIIKSQNLQQDDDVVVKKSGTNYAEIKPKTGDCFSAYDTIIIGLNISKPATCKYSTIQEPYKDMKDIFGLPQLFEEQQASFFIPDPSHGESQGLNWKGSMEFYIKCEDAYEDISPEFFKYSFCVKEGKDARAPIIEKESPENGGLSSFDLDEQKITLVTNEPAQCRWSPSDVAYSAMPNNMSCSSDILVHNPNYGLNLVRPFTCTTTLPTPDPTNTFYINCADQPWLGKDSPDRNTKYDNEVYVLKKPEKKIQIDWIEPNEDIETGSQSETINLKVKTSGGGATHRCKWSMSGYETMFDFPIGSNKDNTYSIPLNLASGTTRTIYANCSDETGDTASLSSTFKIIRDTSPPQVTRIWQESGKLHIITDETGECRYSTETCNFDWDKAPVISGNYEYILPVVKGQRYYIKCEDEYGNHPSKSCSSEIMAV